MIKKDKLKKMGSKRQGSIKDLENQAINQGSNFILDDHDQNNNNNHDTILISQLSQDENDEYGDDNKNLSMQNLGTKNLGKQEQNVIKNTLDTGINILRPKLINEYIGQKKIKDQIHIFIAAAKKRKESLDHVLLSGPPGLGKTTLAYVIANELKVDLKQTTGPALEKTGDLAAILTSLKQYDILFIDEIHRMHHAIEEMLYSALEDFRLDIMIGEGIAARNVSVQLAPFTLVAATTRSGMISKPLLDRFGINTRLEFYSEEDLSEIIIRSSKIVNIGIDQLAAFEIARRSRGTPRIANKLLKRVRDFADVLLDNGKIDVHIADHALNNLGIDKHGLDSLDRAFLKTIVDKFSGGPVGIGSIAASMQESIDTIEETIEPYLLQLGFIKRTNKGRVVTSAGYDYLMF